MVLLKIFKDCSKTFLNILYYSDFIKVFTQISNRFVTHIKIGILLSSCNIIADVSVQSVVIIKS